MLIFAIFHVKIEKENVEQIQKINPYLSEVCDFDKMIDLLFKSISFWHPDAKRVILTDYDSDFSNMLDDIQIYRNNINKEKLMMSRMESQIRYLENECDNTKNIIFLDSDMILNNNISHVFNEEFDLALTYRDSFESMPINGGLFIIKKSAIKKSIQFLKNTLSQYLKLSDKDKAWFGDQLALIKTIGFGNFKNRTGDLITVDNIVIRLFHCNYYNFTPRNNYFTCFNLFYRHKVIFHFKGPQKRLFLPFWTMHFSFKEKISIKEKIDNAKYLIHVFVLGTNEFSAKIIKTIIKTK